jgi:hypothetical protein
MNLSVWINIHPILSYLGFSFFSRKNKLIFLEKMKISCKNEVAKKALIRRNICPIFILNISTMFFFRHFYVQIQTTTDMKKYLKLPNSIVCTITSFSKYVYHVRASQFRMCLV